LETAQLATLQRNEPAYQSNLHGARELLVTYFDQDSGAVTAMLAELDRLAQAQINPELPDISGSLRVLRKTVSTPSDTDEERAPAGADQP
ncbi:MAG: uroporphyrinogen-III C-methyltransferase, partial [Gammaproteobacteria bacterium]